MFPSFLTIPTQPIGDNLTKTDEMEVVYAGYAGGLMSAHIGEDIRIDKIHKYKYRGEQREKIKSFIRVRNINHFNDGRVRILATDLTRASYSPQWTELKVLDEVVVRAAK